MTVRFATILGLFALSTTPLWAAEATSQETAATPAETAAPATDTAPEATPQESIPQGRVARATFTSAVENREPADSLSSLSSDQNKIYYFTELRDMAGQTVTHRWEHNGKVMAEVPFQIGGNRWRVYSSKRLEPSWTGEWKVSVVDSNGSTLSVNTFEYTQAEAAPAEQESVSPATPEATTTTAPPQQ